MAKINKDDPARVAFSERYRWLWIKADQYEKMALKEVERRERCRYPKGHFWLNGHRITALKMVSILKAIHDLPGYRFTHANYPKCEFDRWLRPMEDFLSKIPGAKVPPRPKILRPKEKLAA